MAFSQVTVSGTVEIANAQAAGEAVVTFLLSTPISDGATVILPTPLSARCDSSGSFSITLNANDDVTTTPVDSYYTVACKVAQQDQWTPFNVVVPSTGSGSSVSLFALAQIPNINPGPSALADVVTSLTGEISSVAAQEQGDVAALSAQIATIGGLIPPPPGTVKPSVLTNPVISGTVSTSSVLTSTHGTWANNPTGYSYQWFGNTTALVGNGATTSSYTVQSGDTSKTITCQVTASNAAGQATATSNALTASGAGPTLTVAPVASGTVASGSQLSCTTGTWTGSPTFTYQWFWDLQTAIPGGLSTSSTYVVTATDMTHTYLSCQVTATNANGNLSGMSNPLTVPVTQAPAAPVNTGLPVISGTVSTSSALTCTTGTWSGYPTPVLSYRWYADATRLVGNGADTASYTVQSADTSHLITCVVTATNSAGSASATSNGLQSTGNAPVNTVAPVASGTVATSSTVSCTAGTWTGTGTITETYQWCRNGVPITSGTGYATSSYIIQSPDLPATITCTVTASNAFGAVTQSSNGLTAPPPGGGTVLWTGNTLASYPVTYLQKNALRAYDTTFGGFNCIALLVLNTDTVSTTGARAMIDSPSNIMTQGNRYICKQDLYLPSANFPAWSGWCMFSEQAYGPPFNGSPNLNLMSSDGTNWGPKMGNGVVDAQAPILYDQWNTWVHEFDLSTSGFYQVTLNGTVIYTSNNYPIISSADSTGPWEWHLGIYHQFNIGGGAQFGPMYIKNVSISTPGSTGSAPVNSVAPSISGTVSNGSKLTVTPGTWSGSPTLTHQWFANGTAIPTQTGLTYAVDTTTATAAIYCAETATNNYGKATANSNTLTGSGATVQPNGGPGGTWNLILHDEFTATSLDTTTWDPHDTWTNQNGVTDHLSNITFDGNNCSLILASATSGAAIQTIRAVLAVGNYAEARINFPGSGTTMYNWNAFWATGPSWPANGEEDIMEVGGGVATTNYHDNAGQLGPTDISGTWAGGFHTYGLYRTSNSVAYYWDGALKHTYSTSDLGGAQYLVVTTGYFSGTAHTGSANAVVVDYVRCWAPAS